MRKQLEENIGLFDAIEYSWFHSKRINKANEKAIQIGEKYNLPLIGTSDNHLLRFFDKTYSHIEAEKNIPSLFEAMRKNRIKIISHNLKWWQMPAIFSEMMIRQWLKTFLLK